MGSTQEEMQTLTVLNGLLQLSIEEYPFQEMLQRFLVLITSFPGLGLKPQGAVLLVDENDPQKLVMAAQHNLAPPLLQTCAEVSFGRCLCGRAAASGELLFVSQVDERHENRFEGMPEHGHYCVPIKAADGQLLGVFTLYIPGNYVKKLVVEETLRAVAAALAGIIRHQRIISAKEKLNRELQQAYKMEAIGTLAGGIAHDFNNLLTAILGFSEMVKDDLPAESQSHADMEKVIGAANRARDLTRQILAFSRQSEQEKMPVKMQLVLKEAMKLLRASIPSTISIRQEVDPDCPAILADPGQLHQIIVNLCTNAYYAMKDGGGTMTVGLRPVRLDQEAAHAIVGLGPGDFVQLTVADSGPGIPPEVAARIFEPFFTTKPQGEGTGMGLAIVHGIVAELGGAIQAVNSSGQGAEFRAFFPVATDFDASLKQPTPTPERHGNEKILLVDDESTLLEVSTRNLTKFGYAVTARTSSIEALAAFRAMPEKFDLVLTDQAMPNMTGVDLAREILKIRAVPVILMTGFADATTPRLAAEIGISEVLTKPVDLNDLTRAIRRHLRRGPG